MYCTLCSTESEHSEKPEKLISLKICLYMDAFHTNLYLHDFFEPILWSERKIWLFLKAKEK